MALRPYYQSRVDTHVDELIDDGMSTLWTGLAAKFPDANDGGEPAGMEELRRVMRVCFSDWVSVNVPGANPDYEVGALGAEWDNDELACDTGELVAVAVLADLGAYHHNTGGNVMAARIDLDTPHGSDEAHLLVSDAHALDGESPLGSFMLGVYLNPETDPEGATSVVPNAQVLRERVYEVRERALADSAAEARGQYEVVRDGNGNGGGTAVAEAPVETETDRSPKFAVEYPLTGAQLDEVARVVEHLRDEARQGVAVEEFHVRPATADDAHSMLNHGEVVHYIESIVTDDGGQHDVFTAIGQSGKIYEVDERR